MKSRKRLEVWAILGSRRLLMVVVMMMFLFVPYHLRAQQINAKYEEAPIETVLIDLQKRAKIKIVYQKQMLQGIPAVTCTINEVSIDDALKSVLKNTELTYEIVNNTVMIRRADTDEKTRKVVGVVYSAVDKQPLIGASVVIEGTSIGAVTDIDGRFSLSVTGTNVRLQVSYLGMKPAVVVARPNMEIFLENDSKLLSEVVVTGIFKKAKESYTGAVSSISAEQLTMNKGQNLLQTLRNIDPTVNFAINNMVGSDPNALPQINIRGNSSLPMSVEEFNASASNSVNTPLIILDGFAISLSKLMDYNDDEIESINILKDAAATAIYGSRGSNGVIVITTKKPQEGRLRLNLELGVDIEAPDLRSYDLLNAAEKLQLEKSLGIYDGETPNADLRKKEIYNNRLRSVLSGASTDWLSKPIRTGVGTHYNLRLEGGQKEFRWSISANYKNVEGAMKNSSRKTFNGGITLMYNYKNLQFKNYTSYGITRSQNSNYGSFSDYVRQQPYNLPYDENGEIVRDFTTTTGATIGNPLYNASLASFSKNGYEQLTNNFSVEWKIIDPLSLRGQFGISTTNNHSDIFRSPKDTYFTSDELTSSTYQTDEGFLRRGSYNYGIGKNDDYSANLTLSFNKLFKEKHLLYAGLDYFIQETRYNNYQFQMEGFSNENMNALGNARQYALNGIPYGNAYKTRMMGFTSNINYIFDGKYYVDLAYRIDGSSTFGANKKFAPFWSVGIGWNLHQESFIKKLKYINVLRLKTSYGQTGSQQGSNSGATTIYTYQNRNKYMNWMGANLTAWGNPDLTWQTTDEFNLGVEFGLFQSRLKGEFNYYTKSTSNLLSNMNIPLSMGLPYYIANVGEVKNHGWEASLSGYLVRDSERRINWILGGQFAYNKNYISKLSDAIKAQNQLMLQNPNYDVANLFYEGRPQRAIYAVRSLGIDPSTGREIYLDKDGNRTDVFKPGDKVFLGAAEPLYRGNLNTTLMWKDFTLNLVFSYHWGGKVYNQTLIDRVEMTIKGIENSNVDRRVSESRWMYPGDVTFFKGFGNKITRPTSRFVMSDNVLSLQTVSAQYKWNNNWLRQHIGVQTLVFGVNMSDLFYWSSVRMERGTGYPYARNIQGSVKLMF